MSSHSPTPRRLPRTFVPTRRDVAGLVEELLEACGGEGLQLDWHADRCRLRPLGAENQEATEVPLPKSVFRAILARIAALCNERVPDSVSPYGGEGELAIGTDPPTVFRVAFTNTPGEQRLEVRRRSDAETERVGRRTQLFSLERHGDIAVITPSPEVEKMPESLMEQAAQMVLAPLSSDNPPAGLIFDLSRVDYVGSEFLSFLLRCHRRVKEQGSEVVMAGASRQVRELLQLTALDTLWALYDTRAEALAALTGG
jgi:anti-anti-sigma factor